MEAGCTDVTSPEGVKVVAIIFTFAIILSTGTKWKYHPIGATVYKYGFLPSFLSDGQEPRSRTVPGCSAIPVTGISGNEMVLTATMAMGKLHLS